MYVMWKLSLKIIMIGGNKVNDVKVFKMDDYEWWASKWDKGNTHDYYLKEYGLDKEDAPIEDIQECNLDTEGMWWTTEDPADIERLGDADEIINYETINGRKVRKTKFGNLTRMFGNGEVHKFISLREALRRHGDFEEPFCLASTEW